MINIKHLEINWTYLTAVMQLGIGNSELDRIFVYKLNNLGPTNHEDAIAAANSFDWTSTEPGQYYHVQNNTLTKTPQSPGPTYKFDYTTYTWRDTRTTEQMWADVKITRNVLLGTSDWTQLPDVPLTTKSAWAEYRQLLRDITQQADPFNIIWPQPPGA